MTTENIQEAQTDVEKNTNSEDAQNNANDQVNKTVLFGTIAYTDESAYESFLQKMNISQAVFILMASANFAQAKGSFNLLESETLSTAMRVIRKSQEPQPTEQTTEEKQ